ncbi:MAG TPA: hypothetical protein VF600_00290, partial [Abditibacteriaceae bacterium]
MQPGRPRSDPSTRNQFQAFIGTPTDDLRRAPTQPTGEHSYGRAQLWASTAMGEHSYGRAQLWASTAMGEHSYGRAQLWAS